jgi:hypothetical protein
MFYIRSMTEEFRRTGAPPADFSRLPFPLQPLHLSTTPAPLGGKSLQPQKRMRAVESSEPRKRGGQPGNRNAVKTGWNTAEAKVLRSMIWQFQRQTRALLRDVRADLAARTE